MSGKFMLNGTEYLGGGSGGSGGNVDDVLVNGVSVVNEDKEAEIVSYKEVTQAEYNALPSSKLTDDIMYCIQDVGGADSYPPLIYSDEEREVGVWKNGKPLYQRTVEAPTNLTQDETSCQWDISNIDEVCHVEGVGKWSDGYWFPVPMYHSSSNWACSIYNISSSGYSLFAGWNSRDRGISKIYITVQYTKTTDTAGSGTWTTQGGYAHHYSTDEQVIGTWTDGSTLYEKVITVDNVAQTAKSSPATLTTLDSTFEVKRLESYISIGGMLNLPCGNIPYELNANERIEFNVAVNSSNAIRYNLYSSSASHTGKVTITIQYTKSTD